MKRFTYSRRDVTDAVLGVLEGGARSVVVFCSPLSDPRGRVKVTRVHAIDKRSGTHSVVLTVGRLNYAERHYVRQCKKAGTKPRRIWLKWPKEKSS